jgi:hypothetical protein
MATGHKTGGRVAGTPNKATADIQKGLTESCLGRADRSRGNVRVLNPVKRFT